MHIHSYIHSGDPMMTEPDLVTIGDGACVDEASLIAHINTRGVFRLNALSVGRGCVLQSMTRLLSGARMEDHTLLREHTLVLAGESVDRCAAWQGWPADRQQPLEQFRSDARRLLDVCVRRHFLEVYMHAVSEKEGKAVGKAAGRGDGAKDKRSVSISTGVDGESRLMALTSSWTRGMGGAGGVGGRERAGSSGEAELRPLLMAASSASAHGSYGANLV